MNKRIFFSLTVVFTLFMISCNNASDEIPDKDVDYTNGNETPVDSITSNESRFSQADLDLIACLVDRIPANITAEFNVKMLAWEESWRRPNANFNSNPESFSKTEEYEDLLAYCTGYGKAIWPLIFDLLAQNISAISLLRDLTFEGNRFYFIDEIKQPWNFEADNPPPTLYSNLVDYTKKLLADELDNILQSIQDIP